MPVERWNREQDGEPSEAAVRAKLEKLGYTVSRYVYVPGTYFPAHTHTVDKMDAVVTGRFLVTMEGQSVILGPGDAIAVPRGVSHSAEVVGSDVVVSLDGIRT